MDHKVFVDKGEEFNIVDQKDGDVLVWKYTIADGLTEEDTLTLEAIEDEYKATGTAPDADCYLLVKRNKKINIIRVGKPDPLVIAYTGDTDKTYPYQQNDMDGAELSSGDMTEIGEGFYYAEPDPVENSYFILNEKYTHTFVTPFPDGSVNGTIRLQNATQQYISLPVKDKQVAEYFVDGVCDILGKAEDEVFQLLKSLPSTEDSSGTFKVYKPGTTKRSSSGNFYLYTEDSDSIGEYRSFLCITKDFGQDYVDFKWDSED